MKEKLRELGTIIANWIVENKDILAVVVPVGLVVTGKMITAIRVHNSTVTEVKLKENYIYDRSLGYSLKLKRRLNSKQLALVQARKEAGESLIDILNSMRVLK